MHLDEYKDFVFETAIYPEASADAVRVAQGSTGKVLEHWLNVDYVASKLASESGEVMQEVEKALRDDQCEFTMERKAKIRGELGDTLYYLASVAKLLDMSLDDIAAENMVKLRDRKQRGVLTGSGGDR